MVSRVVYICPECFCIVQTKVLFKETDSDLYVSDDHPLEDFLEVSSHEGKAITGECPGVGLNPLSIEIY